MSHLQELFLFFFTYEFMYILLIFIECSYATHYIYRLWMDAYYDCRHIIVFAPIQILSFISLFLKFVVILTGFNPMFFENSIYLTFITWLSLTLTDAYWLIVKLIYDPNKLDIYQKLYFIPALLFVIVLIKLLW